MSKVQQLHDERGSYQMMFHMAKELEAENKELKSTIEKAIVVSKLMVEAEREACAKVCDDAAPSNWDSWYCATAIRARSDVHGKLI